jgi:WhiB family redox-sensing transcriptional regulator
MSEKFDSELWREKAKCKKMGTDTFFSDTDKSSKLTIRKINQAKAICGDCDVQSQCLSYSLDNNIEYGIWGGFTG